MNNDDMLLPPEEMMVSFSRSGAAMETVSDELHARSRKNYSLILKRMGLVGQVRIAQAINVHESTVSRMKESDFERIARMLAAMGLKVVPEDQDTLDRRKIDAMLLLAKSYVNDVTYESLVSDVG